MKRKDKIAVSVIAVFAVGVLVYLVAPGLLGNKRQAVYRMMHRLKKQRRRLLGRG